jgi:hypothetical protein
MTNKSKFKSVDDLVSESKMKAWEQAKADRARIAASDAASISDPVQVDWERRIYARSSKQEYEIVIPDGVKVVLYVLAFIACVIGLIIFS